MAEVTHISGVEKLLRELATFSDVKVSTQPSGHFFVSVFPKKHAPLWWYGCHEHLQQALQECRDKAVHYRFLPAAQPAEGGESWAKTANELNHFAHTGKWPEDSTAPPASQEQKS